jgi:ketosteroid isomerase-like protein
MKNAVLAVLVLAAAGCADATQSGPVAVSAQARAGSWRVNLKQARQELLAADAARAQATAADLVNGYTSYLTEDSEFLPSRVDVLVGIQAARDYLQTAVLIGSMQWTTVRADVSADGGAGYTIGYGTTTRRDNGATVYMRLISFWQKQADGAWKVKASVPALFTTPAGDVPAGFGTPTDNGVQGAPASAATVEDVLQADRDFAALSVAQNAKVAFVAFAAPTAVAVGGPDYGPEAIGRSFGDGSGFVLSWGPVGGGISGSGDLGYTIGYAKTQLLNPDGTPAGASFSKYVTIWQRQPNGAWLYVADGGTSRAPGAH